MGIQTWSQRHALLINVITGIQNMKPLPYSSCQEQAHASERSSYQPSLMKGAQSKIQMELIKYANAWRIFSRRE